jgi:hypothetical protein
VPPNQGVQPTPLARPPTWAVFTGKRAAALLCRDVCGVQEGGRHPAGLFTGTGRRLARCLCSFLPKLASVTTRRRGAADAQTFGRTSPRSHGRVRPAAASTRAGDAKPARARCGTAMRAGVAVRSCGTAAGRPLDHRVDDRERTSHPDGKARRDPARAGGTAGTGRAAGGAVPSLIITLRHAPGSSSAEAPPACHRTRACSRRRLRGPQPGLFPPASARPPLPLWRFSAWGSSVQLMSLFHTIGAAARTLPVPWHARTRPVQDAQTRRG